MQHAQPCCTCFMQGSLSSVYPNCQAWTDHPGAAGFQAVVACLSCAAVVACMRAYMHTHALSVACVCPHASRFSDPYPSLACHCPCRLPLCPCCSPPPKTKQHSHTNTEDYRADDGINLGPQEVYAYLCRVLYNRRNKFDPLW